VQLPAIFDGLRRPGLVAAVDAALTAAGVQRQDVVIVDGDVALAAALATSGRVVQTVVSGKAARRAPSPIAALPGAPAVAAVVLAPRGPVPDDAFARASSAILDGGALVLVARVAAAEATRRALCAGLSEIEQRTVGGAFVTSGLVTTWAAP
jgi:hypothetical protein